MANNNDKKRSKRTKTKRKPTGKNGGNKDTGTKEKERTITLPKLDAVEKMPSNAPTMAIAPSDYEHIFHEAAPGAAEQHEKAHSPSPVSVPPQQVHQTPSPSPTPPPSAQPSPFPQTTPVVPQPNYALSSRRNEQDYYATQNVNIVRRDPGPLPGEVQVTPDGYTLLGHTPDPSGQRRALPPYIVRANNQFSRAALACVARYLASRAETYR